MDALDRTRAVYTSIGKTMHGVFSPNLHAKNQVIQSIFLHFGSFWPVVIQAETSASLEHQTQRVNINNTLEQQGSTLTTARGNQTSNSSNHLPYGGGPTGQPVFRNILSSFPPEIPKILTNLRSTRVWLPRPPPLLNENSASAQA